MSEELKPCPFCGGEAEQQYHIFMGGEKKYPYARCIRRNCIANKIWFPLEGWNTRANYPNKYEQALLDVLRNKLCDAVDENDHPADQMDNLAAELERLLPDDDMLHAYEDDLERYINADRFNSRAKR